MQLYLHDIKTAALVFPFVALLLTIPYYLYYVHRYGKAGWLRTLIVFSFIFYCLCAYFLVIFPLPTRAELADMQPARANLVPLSFFRNFSQSGFVASQPSTWLHALFSPFVLQYLFNILLLLPLGVYLRYYFECSSKKTLVIAFCVSLFFECSQLTGLFGIYPFAYRSFDVDDLICNTLGAGLGWLWAGTLKGLLPSRAAIDARALKDARHIGLLRRLVALVVDSALVGLGLIAVVSVGRAAGAPVLYSETFEPLLFLLGMFVYMTVLSAATGATPGERLMRLKVVAADGRRPGAARLILRYALALSVPALLVLLHGIGVSEAAARRAIYYDVYEAALVLYSVVLIIETFLNLTLRTRDYFWGLLSGTRLVNTAEKNN